MLLIFFQLHTYFFIIFPIFSLFGPFLLSFFLLPFFSPYLLNETVEVEVVSVPHRSAHLPLDPPHKELVPARLVPEALLETERDPVEMFEDR